MLMDCIFVCQLFLHLLSFNSEKIEVLNLLIEKILIMFLLSSLVQCTE